LNNRDLKKVTEGHEFNFMITEERTTLQCDAVWQTERYVILEPRTCHIAGCWHLANSITCHPRTLCHCSVLPPGELTDMPSHTHVKHRKLLLLCKFNVMWCHRHKPHCRVLPPGEFDVMIAQQRSTLQCAAVWWTERYVIREPRTWHTAGCWQLANSMTCHPRMVKEWSSCRCRWHNCRTSERCRKANQRSFA